MFEKEEQSFYRELEKKTEQSSNLLYVAAAEEEVTAEGKKKKRFFIYSLNESITFTFRTVRRRIRKKEFACDKNLCYTKKFYFLLN